MNIITFYSTSGVPTEELTPTIKIRRVSDNTLIVEDAEMEELGNGFYKYDFSSFDNDQEYVFLCDAGNTMIQQERYATGVTTVEGDIVKISDAVTETIDEATGSPPVSPTLKQALMYLYMQWRNEIITTETSIQIKNNAGTVIASATLSDDGVTFTKSKIS